MSKYRIVKKTNIGIFNKKYKYRFYIQTKFLGIWWTNGWEYNFEQAMDYIPIKPNVCEVV